VEDLNVPTLATIDVPDKTHFKIGEVAKLLELEPYVLRYWEKEFDLLEPSKTESGQRAYQRDDIELLATIRELLYTEMFTIDGARRQLELASEGEPSYLTQRAGGESSEDEEVLEELEWENEQLRREIEEAHEDRLRLEAEVERLEDELEELGRGAENGSADAEELREWRERAEQLEEEIGGLRPDLAEAREEIERLRAENERLRNRTSDPELVRALRGEVDELSRLAETTDRAEGR